MEVKRTLLPKFGVRVAYKVFAKGIQTSKRGNSIPIL